MLDRRACVVLDGAGSPNPPPLDDRSTFEEHRYDALGRRVLLHARQQAFCSSALCRSNVVRTVWDGDQILHEISAPASGAGMELDVQPMLDRYLGSKDYGRVMYVHGGGIDQPLAVVRSEYSDSLPGAALIYPLANHRGQYDRGVGVNHCARVQERSWRLTEPIGEPQVGADTTVSVRDDGGLTSHCVQVDWPGTNSYASGKRQRHAWGPAAPWVGSLLYHGKDPSGQMYRRNRFYEPSSGRFKQEDPIGIAGGLNVYGYTEGIR